MVRGQKMAWRKHQVGGTGEAQQQQPGGGKGMGLAQQLLGILGWREGQVGDWGRKGSSVRGRLGFSRDGWG
jgi:hypothetical protein